MPCRQRPAGGFVAVVTKQIEAGRALADIYPARFLHLVPAFCGSYCPASAPCCSPPSTASWTACVSPTLWARRPLPRSTSSCRCPCCWAPSALCWAPAAVPSWASRWARATRKRPTAISPCSCWRLWSRSVCWPCWALCSCGPLPCCWAQRGSFWTMRCAMDAS